MLQSPDQLERSRQAYELHESGLTYREIQAVFGVGRSVVWRWIVNHRLQMNYGARPYGDKADLVEIMVDIIRQQKHISIRELADRMRTTHNKIEGLLLLAENAGHKIAEDDRTILSICDLQVDVEWTVIGNQDYVRGKTRMGRQRKQF